MSSLKQELFIQEYLKDGNATRSAIAAGYSRQTAAEQGYQLLQNPDVRAALHEKRAQLEAELREQFVMDAIQARKVLYQIMNDPTASHRDRITASRDLLDRGGFRPVDKKEIQGLDKQNIQIRFVEPSK
jgi:phage terminase small subunit